MKGVDTADQIRSYYTSLKIHRRTWKPLFHFLFDMTVTNAYKLSSYATNGWPKRSGHKKFFEQLVNSLFKLSTSEPQSNCAQISMDNIQWYPVVYYGYKAVRINEKQKTCSACFAAGRKSRVKKLSNRKPLCELSVNTTKRSRNRKDFKRPQKSPRTTYGCKLCRIPLCKDGPCWQEHVDRLNSKEWGSIYNIYQNINIFVASFQRFGDAAEQLTARVCTSLIGAHGPHFIERIYPCKG